MKNIKHSLAKHLVASLAAVALFTPLVASAQDVAYGGDQQIQGTVTSINGAWNITVADVNGYRDSIALHQGTIINPTGLTLAPGMNVTIDGYADGANFDATQIDTPYQYNGPAPTAVYYGAGDWYPGYAAGWGPSFTLVFDLNSRRYEQRSFYVGGQVRRPLAPPSGWQNRPHGFIGNANARPEQHTSYIPQQQQRQFAAPPQQQRQFAAPQQQQQFAEPQQREQRSFSDHRPQQQQRTVAQPQQQPHAFTAPQAQQRTFNAPQAQQQPRNVAPQQQQQRPQQADPAAPGQRQRDYSSPVSRAAGSAPQMPNQANGDSRRR